MTKVDNHDIASEFAKGGAHCAKTLTDIKAIGAPQTRDDTEGGTVRDGNRLRSEHGCRHWPVAEAIGKTTIIQPQVQQVSNRAALHIAVDEHD